MKNNKSKLTFLTFLLGMLTTSAQNLTQKTLLIEKGTVLKVKALEQIRSNKIEEGDEVQFEVYEQLELFGKTVIREGSSVKAYIESVEKAKFMGKEGYLRIEFINTTAIDGTKIPLKALRGSIKGEDKLENTIALSVFFSPVFLLKRGGEAKINEGKIMRVNIIKDVSVNVEL